MREAQEREHQEVKTKRRMRISRVRYGRRGRRVRRRMEGEYRNLIQGRGFRRRNLIKQIDHVIAIYRVWIYRNGGKVTLGRRITYIMSGRGGSVGEARDGLTNTVVLTETVPQETPASSGCIEACCKKLTQWVEVVIGKGKPEETNEIKETNMAREREFGGWLGHSTAVTMAHDMARKAQADQEARG